MKLLGVVGFSCCLMCLNSCDVNSIVFGLFFSGFLI